MGAVWNIIVRPAPSSAGGGAAGFAGAGCGAASRITLNVFWHFPQRIVRPCGPMRASSTR